MTKKQQFRFEPYKPELFVITSGCSILTVMFTIDIGYKVSPYSLLANLEISSFISIISILIILFLSWLMPTLLILACLYYWFEIMSIIVNKNKYIIVSDQFIEIPHKFSTDIRKINLSHIHSLKRLNNIVRFSNLRRYNYDLMLQLKNPEQKFVIEGRWVEKNDLDKIEKIILENSKKA